MGDFVSVGGHQVGKTAKNGISAAASSVSGSATSGGVDHTHSFGPLLRDSAVADNYMPPRGSNSPVSGYVTTGGASAYLHTHGLSATAAAQTITGDNETRPMNRGVRYIIKV